MIDPKVMSDIDGTASAEPVDDGLDPEREASLAALKGNAIKVLRDVLATADSDDVRRKAAVDILNFNKEKSVTAPTISEEQLGYLGRVIVEAAEIRERLLRGESEPRSLESVG